MGIVKYTKRIGLSTFFLSFFLFSSVRLNAQLYNKQVKATIKATQNSEYVTFTAIAENLTISGYSLSYDFMAFFNDANGNTTKNSESNGFFIKNNEKLLLASKTINNNIGGKVILVFFIYDIDNKPIGKDRVVVKSDGNNNLIITYDEKPKSINKPVSKDQDTSAKDGIFLEGFVIQKTLTKVGRDFYKYFFSEYYNKKIKSGKNILIKEVPGRGRTTKIIVLVDNVEVWQFFSRPNKTFLKQMASFALQKCIKQLQNLAKQNNGITRY